MRSFTLLAFVLLTLLLPAQKNSFDPALQPAAPDYSDKSSWSALPFSKDEADRVPDSEQWISDSLKDVDVFYIYPTIYRKAKPWNADVHNKALNKKIDTKPVMYQASVFNASARVYAPRYRQSSIKAFSDSVNGPKSLQFAYQDVKRAFQYYLDHYNNGRPIIIASHSQGTYHARKLLKEFFDESPLRSKLVAAYVIGYGFDENMYKNLKPCDNPTQTGCYITWASYKKGYEPGKSVLYSTVCINPLTWTRDTAFVGAAKCDGTMLLDFNKKYPTACGTQIHNGLLWVETSLPLVRAANVLHIADYNLFWYNIRENVADRVKTYLKK